MKKCDTCCESNYVMFIFNGTRQVCKECWVAEKLEKKLLIRKLPTVADRDAPLGWKVIGCDYFADEGVGKTQANILYKYNRMGMVS